MGGTGAGEGEPGFHSVHALPMRLRGAVIGALNLFHIEAGSMRQADVEAAQALADVATIAILQHRAAFEAQILNEQLHRALNTRIVIEQAKGMVADREGLNMEQAFTLLRNHARNTTSGWPTSPTTSSPAIWPRPPSIVRVVRNQPDQTPPT